MKQYPNLLREIAKRNMTIQQYADCIGVHRTSVSGWINGHREISVSALINSAKLFNCSIDYLLGIKEQ